MITAKPVVDQNYWILTQGDAKIGAITADADGYTVNICGRRHQFRTMLKLKDSLKIDLPTSPASSHKDDHSVHGYDIGCRAHNGMWHVKLKIPVFTKSAKSRSWYAAGWYAVQQARTWKIVRNPKLILLQRYKFQGPFYTREESHDKSIS
jgi:hypothetical protein